jgi:hypothetical protein
LKVFPDNLEYLNISNPSNLWCPSSSSSPSSIACCFLTFSARIINRTFRQTNLLCWCNHSIICWNWDSMLGFSGISVFFQLLCFDFKYFKL